MMVMIYDKIFQKKNLNWLRIAMIILWDLDDTLLDFKKSEAYALRKAFEIEGMELTDAQVVSYSAINEMYWKRMERGEITKDEVLEGRFRTFLETEKLSGVDFGRIMKNYPEALGSVYYYNEDARELVMQLKEQGIRQYIITNGNAKVQMSKLEKSGLSDVMDGIFISEEVGFHKPEKAFFDRCMEKIGVEDPAEYLVVGDSLSSDMMGANYAGMPCCWYHPKGPEQTPYEQEFLKQEMLRIDYEIRKLRDLLSILGVK